MQEMTCVGNKNPCTLFYSKSYLKLLDKENIFNIRVLSQNEVADNQVIMTQTKGKVDGG